MVEFIFSESSFIILSTNMGHFLSSSKESFMQKQKHLNLEARILIETSLNQQLPFKSIARELDKDCTTEYSCVKKP